MTAHRKRLSVYNDQVKQQATHGPQGLMAAATKLEQTKSKVTEAMIQNGASKMKYPKEGYTWT